MKLWEYAELASKALLGARPLGGSECFTLVGKRHLADPIYFHSLINEQQTERCEAKLAKVRAEREIARLRSELAQAREAGKFLCERLDDFEREVDDSSDHLIREWHGHVVPALSRFEKLLTPQDEPGGKA